MSKAAVILLFISVSLSSFRVRGETRIEAKAKEFVKKEFFQDLCRGSQETFAKTRGIAFLAAGDALAGLSTMFDGGVRDYFQHYNLDPGLSDFTDDYWGNRDDQIKLDLALMFLGWGVDNEPLAEAGEMMFEAQVVQGLLVHVLKPLVGRERPDGSNRKSFPSSHAATAFTSAAVLHEQFGWKAGIPAYILAGLTAAARIDKDKHWLSDVVAGGVVGMAVGYGISRAHKAARGNREGQTKITLVPFLAGEVPGFGLCLLAP